MNINPEKIYQVIFNKLLLPENYSPVFGKFIRFLRIILISSIKFVKDDGFMMASGISFATMISFMPMLIVVFAILTITQGIGLKKELFFENINQFIIKNNIQFDLTPYFHTISDIIDSASSIGTISFVILIFSATGILRSLESAFEQIWGVENSRSSLQKIVNYIFILSIGPLLFTAGINILQNISTKIRKPHYLAITRYNENLFIAGEKGRILKISEQGEIETITDLENMNIRCYNPVFRRSECIDDNSNLKPLHFLHYQSSLFLITENGIVYYSTTTNRWHYYKLTDNYLKSAHVFFNNTLALVTNSGKLVLFYPATARFQQTDITSVQIAQSSKDMSVIVYNDGKITVQDSKETREYNSSLKTVKNILVLENSIYIPGNTGQLLASHDRGITWTRLGFGKNSFIKIAKSGNILYLLDELGQIYYSEDDGAGWDRFNRSTNAHNFYTEENRAYIVGSQSLYEIYQTDNGIKNIYTSGGDSFSIYSIYQFFVLLVIIWLLLYFIYYFIPGTRMSYESAAYGALFTSVIFYIFIYLFRIYIISFSGTTMIIYKALAAVPIFMLTVYIISLIILFGAEITTVIYYKNRFSSGLPFGKNIRTSGFYKKLVNLFKYLYIHLKKERDFPDKKTVCTNLHFSQRELDEYLSILIADNMVTLKQNDKIIPVGESDSVTLFDFLQVTGYFVTIEDPWSSLSDDLKEPLQTPKTEIENILKNLTFRDILLSDNN